ncbi:hypothetical protein SDC9_101477 [bioreactor metagenome]|uniref:Uncharacterized protein n=1 Tax=bioreactor metagenome TaxID=1076179 RepID=A0A645APK9_9ZZZZ
MPVVVHHPGSHPDQLRLECVRDVRRIGLLGLHHLVPLMHEQIGDRNAYRADLVAGPAQAGRIGQRAVDHRIGAAQLRVQDRADRTRVDRAVGMPTDTFVDRADVQAGRAADTTQCGSSDRVRQHIGTAIVDQHHMHILRTVAFGAGTGPDTGVRIHPLAGRAAWQQLHEDLEVVEGGQDLLDAHHRDQGLRQRQAHPAVALGFHDDQ